MVDFGSECVKHELQSAVTVCCFTAVSRVLASCLVMAGGVRGTWLYRKHRARSTSYFLSVSETFTGIRAMKCTLTIISSTTMSVAMAVPSWLHGELSWQRVWSGFVAVSWNKLTLSDEGDWFVLVGEGRGVVVGDECVCQMNGFHDYVGREFVQMLWCFNLLCENRIMQKLLCEWWREMWVWVSVLQCENVVMCGGALVCLGTADCHLCGYEWAYCGVRMWWCVAVRWCVWEQRTAVCVRSCCYLVYELSTWFL
jgi:hypothetical protein